MRGSLPGLRVEVSARHQMCSSDCCKRSYSPFGHQQSGNWNPLRLVEQELADPGPRKRRSKGCSTAVCRPLGFSVNHRPELIHRQKQPSFHSDQQAKFAMAVCCEGNAHRPDSGVPREPFESHWSCCHYKTLRFCRRCEHHEGSHPPPCTV
jgi:hypothetical protein